MLTLVSILSFLLPTQLAFHFNLPQSTVYGFSVDYLIPAIYLTDIVALAIMFMGVKSMGLSSVIKFNYKYFLYALFVAINIMVSDYQVASIYRWFKITEMLLLGIIILNMKKFETFKHFVKPLSYSVFIACTLGTFQFINKGSIGGIFYWLGERSFLFSDPNVALYPYSIFSHPNSFAGFLLVFAIFLLQYKSNFNHKYFWSLLLLVATNLILTNSLNIYIAIAILVLLKFRNNIALSFLSFDFGARFVTHRIELIEASWQMIKNNFWFGVGLNNFIPNLVKVSNKFVNSWELQPVHNIFLLVFSETGIIGLLSFCFLFFVGLTVNSYPLIAIFATGLSDHYWLTLQQNLLLFMYVVVISKKKNTI